jgi:hypothetical protein
MESGRCRNPTRTRPPRRDFPSQGRRNPGRPTSASGMAGRVDGLEVAYAWLASRCWPYRRRRRGPIRWRAGRRHRWLTGGQAQAAKMPGDAGRVLHEGDDLHLARPPCNRSAGGIPPTARTGLDVDAKPAAHEHVPRNATTAMASGWCLRVLVHGQRVTGLPGRRRGDRLERPRNHQGPPCGARIPP